jgi:hypothetical protein
MEVSCYIDCIFTKQPYCSVSVYTAMELQERSGDPTNQTVQLTKTCPLASQLRMQDAALWYL